jgi:hypothetical protein
MKKLLTLIPLFASSFAIAQAPISINIPDIVVNGTKIKAKAQLFTMTYNQASKYVALNWRVTYYSDSSGKYGSELAINGITGYNKETIADNNTKVNPSTGAVVLPDSTGVYPAGSVGQYDFFYSIAENVDIKVHDLIRSYGAAVTEW